MFNFSLVYFNLKKGITICIYNIEKRVNKKKELKEIFRKIVYTRSLNKVNLFFNMIKTDVSFPCFGQ